MVCEGLMETVQTNVNDFLAFMWNPRTKEVAGRTGKSWIQILVFYIILYACLALWWCTLLWLRVSFLPPVSDGPLHTEYIPHRGPGMNLVPTGKAMSRDVVFNMDDADSYESHIDQINKYFEAYKTLNGEDKSADFERCGDEQQSACAAGSDYLQSVEIEMIVGYKQVPINESESSGNDVTRAKRSSNATVDNSAPPADNSNDASVESTSNDDSTVAEPSENSQEDAPAAVVEDAEEEVQYKNVSVSETYKLYNLLNLGECMSDANYGYDKGEPCLFFTINKAFGWQPEAITDSKKAFLGVSDLATTENFTPLFCQGYKEKDRKMIEKVTYYPEQGFDNSYFPWTGQNNFRQPIVAAKVKLAESAYGKKVRVDCQFYSENVYPAHEKPNIARVEVDLNIKRNKRENTDL